MAVPVLILAQILPVMVQLNPYCRVCCLQCKHLPALCEVYFTLCSVHCTSLSQSIRNWNWSSQLTSYFYICTPFLMKLDLGWEIQNPVVHHRRGLGQPSSEAFSCCMAVMSAFCPEQSVQHSAVTFCSLAKESEWFWKRLKYLATLMSLAV